MGEPQSPPAIENGNQPSPLGLAAWSPPSSWCRSWTNEWHPMQQSLPCQPN